jgi:hypothetical protein
LAALQGELFFLLQYVTDLECPVNHEKKEQVLDWLLGYAVDTVYSDKGEIATAATNSRQ